MIELKEKRDCCGCAACVQRCPRQCIKLSEDVEGFLYPQINVDACVECNLCEKVCPVINKQEARKPFKVYAVKSRDKEVRRQSSSGGLFTHLAVRVIAAGGVVFGARFDERWEVEHAYTETVEGLKAFRGAKYVQSRVGHTFVQAQQFLNEGREVLYVGTPCQIAGLKRFLGRIYNKLLTVDFVCHGTPSPLVWRKYLQATVCPPSTIKGISFRDKSASWRNYAIKVWGNAEIDSPLLYEPYDTNLYMQGFIKDVYLRPSCYACPAKSLSCGSDITLGDYWKIWQLLPEFDDDKGVSLLLINNPACDCIVNEQPVDSAETTYEDALLGNPSLVKSAPMCSDEKRNLFFKQMGVDVTAALKRATYVPLYAHIVLLLKQQLYRLLVFAKIKKV